MTSQIVAVYLYKVMESGIEIVDFGQGKYAIAFATISGCSEPFFVITDKNSQLLNSIAQQVVKASVVAVVDDAELVTYIVYSGIVARDKGSDALYAIRFGKVGQESCEKITGTMPEIQVEVSDVDDGIKNLLIKNISSKQITITKIVANSKDNIGGIVNIAANKSHNIVLTLCATTLVKVSKYKLEMDYVIDDKDIKNKFRVKIDYVCNDGSNDEAKRIMNKVTEFKQEIDMRQDNCNIDDPYYNLCKNVKTVYRWGYEDGRQFCQLKQLGN